MVPVHRARVSGEIEQSPTVLARPCTQHTHVYSRCDWLLSVPAAVAHVVSRFGQSRSSIVMGPCWGFALKSELKSCFFRSKLKDYEINKVRLLVNDDLSRRFLV